MNLVSQIVAQPEEGCLVISDGAKRGEVLVPTSIQASLCVCWAWLLTPCVICLSKLQFLGHVEGADAAVCIGFLCFARGYLSFCALSEDT